jgi:hypothetical protein
MVAYEGGFSENSTSNANLDTLRAAVKARPEIELAVARDYAYFTAAGGRFPSCYEFSAQTGVWAIFEGFDANTGANGAIYQNTQSSMAVDYQSQPSNFRSASLITSCQCFTRIWKVLSRVCSRAKAAANLDLSAMTSGCLVRV